MRIEIFIIKTSTLKHPQKEYLYLLEAVEFRKSIKAPKIYGTNNGRASEYAKTNDSRKIVFKDNQSYSFTKNDTCKSKLDFQQKIRKFIQDKYRINPNRPAAIPYVIKKTKECMNRSQEVTRKEKEKEIYLIPSIPNTPCSYFHFVNKTPINRREKYSNIRIKDPETQKRADIKVLDSTKRVNYTPTHTSSRIRNMKENAYLVNLSTKLNTYHRAKKFSGQLSKMKEFIRTHARKKEKLKSIMGKNSMCLYSKKAKIEDKRQFEKDIKERGKSMIMNRMHHQFYEQDEENLQNKLNLNFFQNESILRTVSSGCGMPAYESKINQDDYLRPLFDRLSLKGNRGLKFSQKHFEQSTNSIPCIPKSTRRKIENKNFEKMFNHNSLGRPNSKAKFYGPDLTLETDPYIAEKSQFLLEIVPKGQSKQLSVSPSPSISSNIDIAKIIQGQRGVKEGPPVGLKETRLTNSRRFWKKNNY
ncbi:unnamed protein product [Moneuplotes crassus]|uniref:Uncharacterized protein n=1 Tax=Euplotes crassus TaxID=5936 RepID=A0AAD1U2I3_EUPCR|nr:unnamed protein product [Moneuplotes crassus]